MNALAALQPIDFEKSGIEVQEQPNLRPVDIKVVDGVRRFESRPLHLHTAVAYGQPAGLQVGYSAPPPDQSGQYGQVSQVQYGQVQQGQYAQQQYHDAEMQQKQLYNQSWVRPPQQQYGRSSMHSRLGGPATDGTFNMASSYSQQAFVEERQDQDASK